MLNVLKLAASPTASVRPVRMTALGAGSDQRRGTAARVAVTSSARELRMTWVRARATK